MTKQDLQQELKEKVKEGVKPSDLRKLKRSKSDSDIPSSPPSQEKQITQLKEQFEFQAQTAANYLKSLQVSQAKVSELEEKLNQLKPTHQSTELDQSLIARHKNLKDWFTQYQRTKELDKELKENIDEASTELVEQDQTISNLRLENNQLKLTNHSLQKDLQLASKLAQMRKEPFANPENGTYLRYVLFLWGVIFIFWLTNRNYG